MKTFFLASTILAALTFSTASADTPTTCASSIHTGVPAHLTCTYQHHIPMLSSD